MSQMQSPNAMLSEIAAQSASPFTWRFRKLIKKTGETKEYTCRVLREDEREQALTLVYKSFTGIGYVWTEEERDQFRKIDDMSVRKEKILEFLKNKTKGKVNSLELAGSPDDVLNCTSRDAFIGSYTPIFETSFNSKMSVGIEYEGRLVGCYIGTVFDPASFLESTTYTFPSSTTTTTSTPTLPPSLADKKEIDPLKYLVEELNAKFAHQFLNSPSFQTSREISLQSNKRYHLAKIEFVAVDFHHRGSNLLAILSKFFLLYAYNLNLRIAFAECSGPISQYIFSRLGYSPLLSCSPSYLDLVIQGRRPYEGLAFKSYCEGADSRLLCVYGNIEKVLERSLPIHSIGLVSSTSPSSPVSTSSSHSSNSSRNSSPYSPSSPSFKPKVDNENASSKEARLDNEDVSPKKHKNPVSNFIDAKLTYASLLAGVGIVTWLYARSR